MVGWRISPWSACRARTDLVNAHAALAWVMLTSRSPVAELCKSYAQGHLMSKTVYQTVTPYSTTDSGMEALLPYVVYLIGLCLAATNPLT